MNSEYCGAANANISVLKVQLTPTSETLEATW